MDLRAAGTGRKARLLMRKRKEAKGGKGGQINALWSGVVSSEEHSPASVSERVQCVVQEEEVVVRDTIDTIHLIDYCSSRTMKTQLLIAAACVASAGAFSASVSFRKKVERSRSTRATMTCVLHPTHSRQLGSVRLGVPWLGLAAAHSQQLLLV